MLDDVEKGDELIDPGCDGADGDSADDMDIFDDVTYGEGGGDGNAVTAVVRGFVDVGRGEGGVSSFENCSFVEASPHTDEAGVGIDGLVVVVISVTNSLSTELLWDEKKKIIED